MYPFWARIFLQAHELDYPRWIWGQADTQLRSPWLQPKHSGKTPWHDSACAEPYGFSGPGSTGARKNGQEESRLLNLRRLRSSRNSTTIRIVGIHVLRTSFA